MTHEPTTDYHRGRAPLSTAKPQCVVFHYKQQPQKSIQTQYTWVQASILHSKYGKMNERNMYRDSPLMQKSLKQSLIMHFLAYVHGSGGFFC